MEALPDYLKEYLQQLVDKKFKEYYNPARLLTSEELCEIFQLEGATRIERMSKIRYLHKKGLSYVNVGKSRRYLMQDVIDFMNKHRENNASEIKPIQLESLLTKTR